MEAKSANIESTDQDMLLSESKAALDAERNTTKRLEKALASALADNAILAAELHRQDNKDVPEIKEKIETVEITTTNICAIDSFLAD